MISGVATSETTTSATFVDLTTFGPAIVAPRAGEYVVRSNIYMFGTNVSSVNLVGVKNGAATTLDKTGPTHLNAVANHEIQTSTIAPIFTIAAGATVAMQYRVTAGTGTFGGRYLELTPLRIS